MPRTLVAAFAAVSFALLPPLAAPSFADGHGHGDSDPPPWEQEGAVQGPEGAPESVPGPAAPEEAMPEPEGAPESVPGPEGAAGSVPGPAAQEEAMQEPEGAAGSSPGPAAQEEAMPEPEGEPESAPGPAAQEEAVPEPEGEPESVPGPAALEEAMQEPEGEPESVPGPAALEEAMQEPEGAAGSVPGPEGAMESVPGPEGGAEGAPGPSAQEGAMQAPEGGMDVPEGMLPAGSLPVVDLGPPPTAEGAVMDVLSGGLEALSAGGAERMAEAARRPPAPSPGASPGLPLEGVAPPSSVAPGDLRAADFGDARAALGRAAEEARSLLADELAGVAPPAVMDRPGDAPPTVGQLEEAGREVQLMQHYGELFALLQEAHSSSAGLRQAAVDARIEGIGRAVALLEAIDAGQAALSGLGEGDLARFLESPLPSSADPGLGVAVLRAGPMGVSVRRVEALSGGAPGTGSLQVARDRCTGRVLGPGSSCDIAYSWRAFPVPGSLLVEVADPAGRGSQVVAAPFQGAALPFLDEALGPHFDPSLDGPLTGVPPDRVPPEFRPSGAPSPEAGPAPPAWLTPSSGIHLVSMTREVASSGGAPEVWLRRYAEDGSWSDFRGLPGSPLPWGGTLVSADLPRQSAFVERADGEMIEVRAWWPGGGGGR